jgi:hypothetical protein
MGDTVFANMINQLYVSNRIRARDLRITRTEFEHWQKIYTWDAIKGIPYGESFCKFFDIYDVFLMVMKTWATSDLELYIQEEYVV